MLPDKPLRFDVEDGPFFPDFWLLDVGRDCPLAAFGMATPDYLAHQALKIDWYTERYGAEGWWNWDAAADPGGRRHSEVSRSIGQVLNLVGMGDSFLEIKHR